MSRTSEILKRPPHELRGQVFLDSRSARPRPGGAAAPARPRAPARGPHATASRGAAACAAARPRSAPGTAAARIASWPRAPASRGAWPRPPASAPRTDPDAAASRAAASSPTAAGQRRRTCTPSSGPCPPSARAWPIRPVFVHLFHQLPHLSVTHWLHGYLGLRLGETTAPSDRPATPSRWGNLIGSNCRRWGDLIVARHEASDNDGLSPPAGGTRATTYSLGQHAPAGGLHGDLVRRRTLVQIT
jgi:hypothetical protein